MQRGQGNCFAHEGACVQKDDMYKFTCAYCKWEDRGIVTISGMTERDSMAPPLKLEEVRELARKFV